jgi:hypothetical protein
MNEWTPGTGLYELLRHAVDLYGADQVQKVLNVIVTHPRSQANQGSTGAMEGHDSERERFQTAMRRMRDIFSEMQRTILTLPPGASTSIWNDAFFDSYEEAELAFGDVLLQRDVRKG